MKIAVNDQVHLSEFHSSDKPALIQHLNDRNIYPLQGEINAILMGSPPVPSFANFHTKEYRS